MVVNSYTNINGNKLYQNVSSECPYIVEEYTIFSQQILLKIVDCVHLYATRECLRTHIFDNVICAFFGGKVRAGDMENIKEKK